MDPIQLIQTLAAVYVLSEFLQDLFPEHQHLVPEYISQVSNSSLL